MRVADADEAVRLANDSQYGLQASVYTRDMAKADGIARRLDPGKRLDVNMYEPGAAPAGIPRLPLNLLDSLRAFQGSTLLREALGSDFVDAYVKLRMAQWNEYTGHLTEWEREHTLDV